MLEATYGWYWDRIKVLAPRNPFTLRRAGSPLNGGKFGAFPPTQRVHSVSSSDDQPNAGTAAQTPTTGEMPAMVA